MNTENDIKEVFSMLSDLCIPTINKVFKAEMEFFLSEVVKVINEQDFNYLNKVLSEFDIKKIEDSHDKLNLNFVEFTYAFFHVWMEYIHTSTNKTLKFSFQVDREFIESTNEMFFKCFLNADILNFYKELYQLDEVRLRLLETDLNYKNIVFRGLTDTTNSFDQQLNFVFEILKNELEKLDADNLLFSYIDEYKKYCFNILESINRFNKVIKEFKTIYLQTCVEVFGKIIDELYNELEIRDIKIELFDLKMHMLKFLKVII